MLWALMQRESADAEWQLVDTTPHDEFASEFLDDAEDEELRKVLALE